MKKEFSTKWKASKQPRKQRKYLANAPFHLKQKITSSQLSKDLRKKYGKRSFPVRKGDKVKIMRGELKDKIGKILIVDREKLRVNIEGIYRAKNDGTKVVVWINTSNLQIQELDLEDKKRKEALERKGAEKKIKKLPKSEGEQNA
jgi:large subunit ribosomal protein L24